MKARKCGSFAQRLTTTSTVPVATERIEEDSGTPRRKELERTKSQAVIDVALQAQGAGTADAESDEFKKKLFDSVDKDHRRACVCVYVCVCVCVTTGVCQCSVTTLWVFVQ